MTTEVNELSRLIALLRGTIPIVKILKGADVSRETFRKIQHGLPVKLGTLMDIADFLKTTEAQRTELVIAWIKLEIGRHAQRISIQPRTQKQDEPDEIATLLKQLTAADREQMLLAMVRPEVRRAIAALNKLHDNLKRQPAPTP